MAAFRQSQASLASLLTLSTVPAERQPFLATPDTPDGGSPGGGLELREVAIYHDVGNLKGSSRPTLHSVSLYVPRGAKVGVVGKSGCGKTTLLKLIARLYHPGERPQPPRPSPYPLAAVRSAPLMSVRPHCGGHDPDLTRPAPLDLSGRV